jgi:hypothetical protein
MELSRFRTKCAEIQCPVTMNPVTKTLTDLRSILVKIHALEFHYKRELSHVGKNRAYILT